MATEKQIAANRANAAKSTGPRTASGKAKSRLNALAHGLAAALPLDPGADEEARTLRGALAPDEAPPHVKLLAAEVAEAEVYLRRVRAAQRELASGRPVSRRHPTPSALKRFLETAPPFPTGDRSKEDFRREMLCWKFEERAEKIIARLESPNPPTLAQMMRVTRRYERRAVSRRRSAIRAFDRACAEEAAIVASKVSSQTN